MSIRRKAHRTSEADTRGTAALLVRRGQTKGLFYRRIDALPLSASCVRRPHLNRVIVLFVATSR